MPDPTITKLTTDIISFVTWVLTSFWVVSGMFSTLAAALPAPIVPTDGQKPSTDTILQKLLAGRWYHFWYRVVNVIAQNFGKARNAADPKWRMGINTMIRVLVTALASGAAGPAASAALKEAAALDEQVTENLSGNKTE